MTNQKKPTNHVDQFKEITIDWRAKAVELLGKIPHVPTEYTDAQNIHWDVRFIYDYVRTTYEDAFVNALNAGIPGLCSTLKAEDLLDSALDAIVEITRDEWFKEYYAPSGITVSEMNQQHQDNLKANKIRLREHIVKYKLFFRELTLEIYDEVYGFTGRPCTDLWTTHENEEGRLVCKNEGDFRIIEWEMMKLDEDGLYIRPHHLGTDVDLDTYITSPVQVSSRILKDREVCVIGFNLIGEHEFDHSGMKSVLRGLGANPTSHLSAQTDLIVASRLETLTPVDRQSLANAQARGIHVVSEETIVGFLNTSSAPKASKKKKN
ncbi:hypothetical protein CZP2022_212 [Vibrio phage C-ZP2022]|nr:hypothetical protein CZP2022_212 [Vibrio phage C-ZP2022]